MLPHLCLAGGCEEGRLQAGAVHQTGGQLKLVNLTGLAIRSQTGAGQVATHDALNREHVQRLTDHGAASHHLGHVGRQHMVGHTLELLKPPEGHLGQNLALIGNLGGKHLIEGADTVGGNHHHGAGPQFGVVLHVQAGDVLGVLVGDVEVTDLAGIHVLPAGNVYGGIAHALLLRVCRWGVG